MKLAFLVENVLPDKMGIIEEAKELYQLKICLVEDKGKPDVQWFEQMSVFLTYEI